MLGRRYKGFFAAGAALVLLGALVRVLGPKVPSPLPDGAEALARLLQSADPDVLVAVHLPGQGGQPVRLARDGRRWTVNGHAADSGAIASFWRQVRSARVVERVGQGAEQHGRLGIGPDAALTVVFERATAADTLFVGKAGPLRGGFFARLAGEEAVYRVDAELRTAVLRDAGDWRSRRIVALDTGAVASLAVARDDGAYVLSRTPAGWTLDGEPAIQAAVVALLSELTSLDASGFPGEVRPRDPDEISGLRYRTVTAWNGRGELLAALELRGGSGQWEVRLGDEAADYLVPAWRVERVTPERALLMDSPVLPGHP